MIKCIFFQPAAVQYINYVFDPGNSSATKKMFEIGKQEMPQRNVSLCFFGEKSFHQRWHSSEICQLKSQPNLGTESQLYHLLSVANYLTTRSLNFLILKWEYRTPGNITLRIRNNICKAFNTVPSHSDTQLSISVLNDFVMYELSYPLYLYIILVLCPSCSVKLNNLPRIRIKVRI